MYPPRLCTLDIIIAHHNNLPASVAAIILCVCVCVCVCVCICMYVHVGVYVCVSVEGWSVQNATRFPGMFTIPGKFSHNLFLMMDLETTNNC